MKIARPLAAAALALSAALPPVALAQGTAHAEAAKWFVLRGATTGDCWTAKLIVMNGQYASGSARIAGGPYATEAEAEARIQALKDAATCR